MKFFKKKEKKILAFSNGTVVPLKDVNDPMFSKGLMGPGIAIESNDGMFYSPVDGVVTMLFPTKHAMGIKCETGEELLLHIGIDTVNLKGDGFESFVKDGQHIAKGDLLLKADLSLIKENNYQTVAILCITDPKDLKLTYTLESEVKANESLLISIG